MMMELMQFYNFMAEPEVDRPEDFRIQRSVPYQLTASG